MANRKKKLKQGTRVSFRGKIMDFDHYDVSNVVKAREGLHTLQSICLDLGLNQHDPLHYGYVRRMLTKCISNRTVSLRIVGSQICYVSAR